ncbi:hypothetical protein GOBAR_AA02447 [Gossypium barbadense]|uniref:Uncharacterized protein n=1 Tax=Gossypium barbadense TaxID=3634 RepID=A0A2P5YRD1_GOSBA|nr:hypothetical protein GOBAR_AA02447 [Gossypium barbadense]
MQQILVLPLLNLMKKFLLRYSVFSHMVQSRYFIPNLAQLRVFQSTQPGTRACCRPCSHHKRRHDHAIWPYENREKNFPNTGYDKSPQPWDKAVGEPKQHGCTTRSCLETVGEPVNLARAFDTSVPSTCGRHCQNEHGHGPMYTGVGEVNEARHGHATRPCAPTRTRNTSYFGFLNTAAQSSFLTLIGQMSPQGISGMLSMRMIEKRYGTYPPQYRLVQSTEEEDPEDITDDVPPRHEDPPSQPPPIHHPVHAVASYSDIFECLT